MISLMLVTASVARAGPLLDLVPLRYRNDQVLKTKLCDSANRLVVADVTATEIVVVPKEEQYPLGGGHLPAVYTIADYTVERQISLGDLTSSFVLHQGGGVFGDKVLELVGWPTPSVGERYAYVLHYPNSDFSSPRPSVLEWRKLSMDVVIPSNSDLDAAYTEFCSE